MPNNRFDPPPYFGVQKHVFVQGMPDKLAVLLLKNGYEKAYAHPVVIHIISCRLYL